MDCHTWFNVKPLYLVPIWTAVGCSCLQNMLLFLITNVCENSIMAVFSYTVLWSQIHHCCYSNRHYELTGSCTFCFITRCGIRSALLTCASQWPLNWQVTRALLSVSVAHALGKVGHVQWSVRKTAKRTLKEVEGSERGLNTSPNARIWSFSNTAIFCFARRCSLVLIDLAADFMG